MFPEGEDERSVVSMEAYSELHKADHKGRWFWLFSLFDCQRHIMGIVVVDKKKKKNKARSKI